MEDDALQALIKQLERMLGYVPIGTKDLLKVLTHPDCIEFLRNYMEEVDK